VLWWLRKRREPKGRSEGLAVRPEALRVVQLYRDLEKEMNLWGVPRSAHTPPLAHAAALGSDQHPIADDVMALTLVYQEVRFGERAFGPDEDSEFRTRLTALRKDRAAA
jgi:hypothetical protein